VRFEEAMKRLEEIVEKLEDPQLSLEESLKLFEEGSRLVKLCEGMLDKAEKRIKLLTEAEMEGELQAEENE